MRRPASPGGGRTASAILKVVVYTGSGLTIFLATLAMIGWLTPFQRLADFSPNFIPMAPSTAGAFLIAGIALPFCYSRAGEVLRTIAFAIVTFLAVSELVHFFLHLPVAIDRLIVPQPVSFNGVSTGRMSPLTAAGLLVLGIAGVCGPRRQATGDLAGLLAFVPFLVGAVVVFGYVYGKPLLYRSGFVPVALTTALAFTSMGIALTASAGPDHLPFRIAVGSSAQARMIRAFLPSIPLAVLINALVIVVFPFANRAVALAIFGVLMVVLVTVNVIVAAHVLGKIIDDAHAALADSEAELRAIFDGTGDAIVIVDDSGICVDANHAACLLFGLAHHNLIGLGFKDILSTGLDSDAKWARFLRLRQSPGDSRIRLPDGRIRDVEYTMTANILPQRHLVVLRDVTESRKRTLESERLAAIVGSSFDAVYSKDLDGRIVSWNPSAQRIFGYAPSEVIGRTEELLFPPEERNRIARAALELMKGERAEERELTAFHKTGAKLLLSLSESPIWNSAGGLVGTSVIARDTTAHRAAEKALRESEEKLRAFFDSRAVGIVFAEVDGPINDANEAFLDLLGYTREELEAGGLSWVKLTPPEFLTIDKLAVEEARRTGSCHPYEKQYLRKDGTILWVIIGFVLLEPERRDVVAFIVDINDKKRTEEALKESEARFARMFQSSPVAMAMSEAESGRLIDVNERWCDFFGYERSEVLGKTAFELNLWPNQEARRELIDRVEDREAFATVEAELRRKSGETRYALLSMTASVFTSKSEEVRMVTLVDTTERRELESQLIQSQKMEAIGRLAGGVAHDFNNMLGVILGFAELLEKGLEGSDRAKIQQIVKAAKRAASLTNQLLAFSRKQLLEPKVVNLNDLIRSTVTMLRRLIGEDIHLETRLAPEIGRVKADPGQLEQVIMNLAVNSRDAMPDGGTLRISTENAELDEGLSSRHEPVVPGRYVMFSVTDSGSGMDAETVEHLFEPFFTTKEQGKGTGLGLSTAYGIIKQSAGYVWVFSEPGYGTTFKVYLPRIDGISDVETVDAGSEGSLGTETILLAEDEPSLRAMIAEVLRQKGYEVIPAENGRAAMGLASSRTGDIALLITDVVMPEMGGGELAESLVERVPGLKVLFISGYAADTTALDALLAEKARLLSKPFSNSDLLKRVRQILDEPPPSA